MSLPSLESAGGAPGGGMGMMGSFRVLPSSGGTTSTAVPAMTFSQSVPGMKNRSIGAEEGGGRAVGMGAGASTIATRRGKIGISSLELPGLRALSPTGEIEQLVRFPAADRPKTTERLSVRISPKVSLY